jgi:hypothetical protein
MSSKLFEQQSIPLDATVWGPHFWFVLHTIAITYPTHPTSTMKKKCYDLIQNLALFLPNEKIGNRFLEYLDKFPVTPYLDNRLSFMKWVHFIHNKINKSLGKEEVDFFDSLDIYYDHYKPKVLQDTKQLKYRKYIYIGCFSTFLILIIYYLYNK